MHRSRNASNSASVPLSSVSTIWPTRALIASPPCCAAAGMIAQAKSAPTAITNRRARPNCQPAIGGLPVLTSGTRLHLRGRVKPAAARNSLAKQGQYLTQPVAHPCTCDGGGNGHADFEDHGENDVGHRLAPIAPPAHGAPPKPTQAAANMRRALITPPVLSDLSEPEYELWRHRCPGSRQN